MATVRSVVVRIGADISQFSRQMQSAGNQMQRLGGKLTGIGKSLTSAITVPIVALGTASVYTAMQFEKSMSEVKAVTGATGTEFKQLSDKAKEMGSRTSKSATEAAQAIKFMGLAGFTTTEILTSLEPVLRLSEAGNIDLARTSDLVTDSMSALGLTTEQLVPYLDQVAQTSRNANTDIDALMEAFIIVGGTIRDLKIPLDEANALLGIMANRGIKGAEAGNSLSSILINLTTGAGQAGTAMKKLNFSAFDSEGKFKGVANILKELNGLLQGATEEQKNMVTAMIGGKTQVTTLNALLDGMKKEYKELNLEVLDSNGALNEMAETMQDNLTGELNKLKSGLEGVAIQIGNILIPVINDLVTNFLIPAVEWFANLDDQTKKNIITIGLAAAAVGPLIVAIGTAITAAGAFSAALGALGLSMSGIIVPIGLTVVALTSWGIAVYKLWTGWEEFKNGFQNIMMDIRIYFTRSVTGIITGLLHLKKALIQTVGLIQSVIPGTTKTVKEGIEDVNAAIQDVELKQLRYEIRETVDMKERYKKTMEEIAKREKEDSSLKAKTTEQVEKVKKAFDDLEKSFKSAGDKLKNFTGASKDNSAALLEQKKKLRELQQEMQENISKTNSLGKAIVSALKKKYKEQSDAQEKAIKQDLSNLKERYKKEQKLLEKSLDKQVDMVEFSTKKKIKSYEKEYDARLKTLNEQERAEILAIQQKIDAIEDLTEKEEKQIEEAEYNKNIAEKKAQIESIKQKIKSDINKVAITKENAKYALQIEQRIAEDGNKEIAKIEDEIKEMQADRNRKLLLEQRDETIAAYQKDIDDLETKYEKERAEIEKQLAYKRNSAMLWQEWEKEIYEEELKDNKKRYEDLFKEAEKANKEKLEENKKYYEELMKEDELQNKARKLLLKQSSDEVIDLLKEYEKDWQDAGQSYGEAMLKGLNSQKQSIRNAVNEIASMVKSVSNVGSRIKTSDVGEMNSNLNTGSFLSNSLDSIKKSDVNVNITGNTISSNVDVDLLGTQMVSKLRMAGVMK